MKKYERDILRWYERRALMTQQTSTTLADFSGRGIPKSLFL